MIPDRTLIWTPRGYKNIRDLSVGDKVISFNPDKGYMEYDEVFSIKTDFYIGGLLGVKKVGCHFLLTPAHDILFINTKSRDTKRVPIEDRFMENAGGRNLLLGVKPFEPYKRSVDFDDVRWSARMAASSCRQDIPPLYEDKIWDIIKDITAPEAQEWLNTFFTWNILKPNPNYMRTVLMRNWFVRNMLYHVAPRAGVSTYWGPYRTKTWFQNAFSLTKEGDHQLQRIHWRADRHESIVYNIKTKNGNFLARYLGGLHIQACEVKESDPGLV